MEWSETNKQLYSAACNFLSRREYGRQELIGKLEQKFECPIKNILDVMDFLRDKNFQSDARYASSLVRSKFNKFYGPSYIRQCGFVKGVSSNLIEDNMSELDFEQKCFELAEKFRHFPEIKLKRKLIQKGFSYRQVSEALEKLA